MVFILSSFSLLSDLFTELQKCLVGEITAYRTLCFKMLQRGSKCSQKETKLFPSWEIIAVPFLLCGFITGVSVELVLLKNSLNPFKMTYERYHMLWNQLVNFTYFQIDV